jgi:hypothetical protein
MTKQCIHCSHELPFHKPNCVTYENRAKQPEPVEVSWSYILDRLIAAHERIGKLETRIDELEERARQ